MHPTLPLLFMRCTDWWRAIWQAGRRNRASEVGNAVQGRLNLAVAPHESVGVAAPGVRDLYVPARRQQAQVVNLAGRVRKRTPDGRVLLLVEDKDDVGPAHLTGA